jgi:hypothetical protein
MKPFTYERATSVADAAAKATSTPDAKFIAGGTNLLDLMKLQIEAPAHLIDVNGLGLDKIEETPEGGLRIGALVRNTDLAADMRVRRDYGVLSRAHVWPERPGNCATRPPLPAICSSARDARIFTTPICPATSDCPEAAVQRSKAIRANSR